MVNILLVLQEGLHCCDMPYYGNLRPILDEKTHPTAILHYQNLLRSIDSKSVETCTKFQKIHQTAQYFASLL